MHAATCPASKWAKRVSTSACPTPGPGWVIRASTVPVRHSGWTRRRVSAVGDERWAAATPDSASSIRLAAHIPICRSAALVDGAAQDRLRSSVRPSCAGHTCHRIGRCTGRGASSSFRSCGLAGDRCTLGRTGQHLCRGVGGSTLGRTGQYCRRWHRTTLGRTGKQCGIRGGFGVFGRTGEHLSRSRYGTLFRTGRRRPSRHSSKCIG